MILVALRDIQKAGWTGLVKVERCWRKQVLFNPPRHGRVKSLLIFQTTSSCVGMNLNPLMCAMIFSFRIWPFLLFCVSLNLGAASNQVKPTDGIPTLMADANDHQRVSDTKHRTQCKRKPKSDTKHNANDHQRVTQNTKHNANDHQRVTQNTMHLKNDIDLVIQLYTYFKLHIMFEA